MGINDTATGLQMTKEVLTNQLKEITKNFDVDSVLVVNHPINKDFFYVRICIDNRHYGSFGNYSDITNFYNGLIAGLNIGLIHARKVIQKTKKDLKM
jgi:hypothetical protein